MDSKRHFLISFALGFALAAVLNTALPDPVLVGYAAVLGVAIDFDHFLVSRLYRGDWKATRRCLADPRLVFFDQSAIFDDDDLWPRQRLLSHVAIIGAFVPGVFVVAGPSLALVSGVVLYAHVLADLIEDNRNHERYLEKAAQVVERDGAGGREHAAQNEPADAPLQ